MKIAPDFKRARDSLAQAIELRNEWAKSKPRRTIESAVPNRKNADSTSLDSTPAESRDVEQVLAPLHPLLAGAQARPDFD
jgi:hypothetical protein